MRFKCILGSLVDLWDVHYTPPFSSRNQASGGWMWWLGGAAAPRVPVVGSCRQQQLESSLWCLAKQRGADMVMAPSLIILYLVWPWNPDFRFFMFGMFSICRIFSSVWSWLWTANIIFNKYCEFSTIYYGSHTIQDLQSGCNIQDQTPQLFDAPSLWMVKVPLQKLFFKLKLTALLLECITDCWKHLVVENLPNDPLWPMPLRHGSVLANWFIVSAIRTWFPVMDWQPRPRLPFSPSLRTSWNRPWDGSGLDPALSWLVLKLHRTWWLDTLLNSLLKPFGDQTLTLALTSQVLAKWSYHQMMYLGYPLMQFTMNFLWPTLHGMSHRLLPPLPANLPLPAWQMRTLN